MLSSLIYHLKCEYSVIIVTHISHVIFSYIQPKCVKTSEAKDKQLCIAVHIINDIHDANPLDN